MDDSPDGILIEARDRIAYINRAYSRILGYAGAQDLASATIRDIAHEEERDRLAYYGRLRLEGKPVPSRYEFRAYRRDHSVALLEAHVWLTRIGSEVLIATVAHAVVAEDKPLLIEGLKRLSIREQEVFDRLLAGRRSKEIALELDISVKTVGTHRSRVYQKLAFRSDLDMFRFAAQNGLLVH